MIARVVIALGVAALAAVAVLWAGRRAGRPAHPSQADHTLGTAPAWPMAVAVSAPAPIAYVIAFGWPGERGPPVDSLGRTAWMLVLIAVAAVVISTRLRLRDMRWVMLAAPLGVIAPQALREWSISQTASTLLVAALGGLVLANSLDALERRGRAGAAMLVLGLLAAAASIALAGAASLTISVVAAAMVVPALITAGAAALRPGAMTGVVAHAAAGAALACMLTAAWSYTADLPLRTHAGLRLLPFCAGLAAIADTLVGPRMPVRARTPVCVAAAVIPAAVLVVVGFNRIEW